MVVTKYSRKMNRIILMKLMGIIITFYVIGYIWNNSRMHYW